MVIAKILESSREFEIQTYKKPEDIRQMNLTHVSFSGTPLHHPYDNEKVVLLVDPFSSNTLYYEFFSKDISYAEHLENIVDPEGKNLDMQVMKLRHIVEKNPKKPKLIQTVRGVGYAYSPEI